MRILYLAHDLADPAIAKRVMMLLDGGASVTLAGFRRTPAPVDRVSGLKPVDFGQTFNGGFLQRLCSVVMQIACLKKRRLLFTDADMILARNLEMLAIAVRGRHIAGHKPVIAYECLDIHRLLLGHGFTSNTLRRLEGWLSRRAAIVLTSSPAFQSHYFATLSQVRLPVKLVENKVYPAPAHITASPRIAGPPWKIGWFGVIRCRKSLDMLCRLVTQYRDSVQVIIRGRPALDQFDDFHHTVTHTLGIQFLGPYKNPDDLADIYRDVHFTWAIDRYEEGLNSSWLLPNRLYEGGLYGAVPIGLKDVETGRTLDKLGIGITLTQPYDDALAACFSQMTPECYRTMEAAVLSKPRDSWTFSRQDCISLVQYLGSLTREAAHG